MKKHFIYWILVVTTNYALVFGEHYLVRPFWFSKSEYKTDVTSVETLFTILILPMALVVIDYFLTKKYKMKYFFIITSLIVLSCIIISEKLHFFNWADSIGSRTNPDSETLEVGAFERSVGIIVASIGLIIAFVKLFFHKSSQKDTLNLDNLIS